MIFCGSSDTIDDMRNKHTMKNIEDKCISKKR